jgi:pimeloyl-ACP methyl ester carboxylesterase
LLKSILFLGALLATLPAVVAAATPATPAQTRTCHLPGVEEALRCLTLPVPLEPGKPATLNLHVTIAPALRQGARPDPLFVLAGGPGEAGSDVLPLLSTAFRRVRATRDIVFIDQRGTGLSGKLDCPSDGDADAQLSDLEADAAMRRCIAASKAPFAAYTTAAAARDIEAVRRALGYEKINLWGGSYGTRLAQAYARAYPNLRGEFDALVARLDAGPLTLNLPDPRTARQVDVTLTSARLLDTVRSMLYSPADARRLPFLVHSASAGRWQPFVARRNLAADFAAEGAPATLLHLAVVCAEDMPRFTPALAAADASPLTRTLADRLKGLCRAMNVPAVPYVAPTRIAAPALLLSGALDPVTPPRRAQDAARFMAKAQLLTAPNVGHGVSQLGCAPRLLRAFLDRPEASIDSACLNEIPAPTFQLGSAGPQP